jgi:hypothetical protein
VYKPKRKSKETPEEKLAKYVEHKASTKDSDNHRNRPQGRDERDELAMEKKDGLSHDQRKKGIFVEFEKDETIASTRHALLKEKQLSEARANLLIEKEDQEERDYSLRYDLKWSPDPEDVTDVHKFSILPSSSVYCKGDSRETRVCRFRNLCYSPHIDKWFVSQTNRSVQHNVPIHRKADGLLQLSTAAAGNPAYSFDFDEISPFEPRFRNMRVRYEEGLHFMFMRYANNLLSFDPLDSIHLISSINSTMTLSQCSIK